MPINQHGVKPCRPGTTKILLDAVANVEHCGRLALQFSRGAVKYLRVRFRAAGLTGDEHRAEMLGQAQFGEQGTQPLVPVRNDPKPEAASRESVQCRPCVL